MLRDVQARIAKGEFLGLTEERVTFKELTERYLSTYMVSSLGPNTCARCEGIIQTRLLPCFGDKRLSSITAKEIEEYKAERAAHVKPATVNRELSRLRHMLSMAVR